MGMTKTYKQVVEAFTNLTSKHYQVKGFINNHPLQVNRQSMIYPVVAMYPGDSSIDRNVLYLEIKFFVMDLLMSDYSNEVEVLSDCLQIGNDFIQELYQQEDTYGFTIDEETVTMQAFAQNFASSEDTDLEDDVAGWFFEFTIDIQNEFNNCTLPFNQ